VVGDSGSGKFPALPFTLLFEITVLVFFLAELGFELRGLSLKAGALPLSHTSTAF
jgi:hypothetical protein